MYYSYLFINIHIYRYTSVTMTFCYSQSFLPPHTSFFVCLFLVLGLKNRAWYILDKHAAPKLYPQYSPFSFLLSSLPPFSHKLYSKGNDVISVSIFPWSFDSAHLIIFKYKHIHVHTIHTGLRVSYNDGIMLIGLSRICFPYPVVFAEIPVSQLEQLWFSLS